MITIVAILPTTCSSLLKRIRIKNRPVFHPPAFSWKVCGWKRLLKSGWSFCTFKKNLTPYPSRASEVFSFNPWNTHNLRELQISTVKAQIMIYPGQSGLARKKVLKKFSHSSALDVVPRNTHASIHV